MLKPLKVVIENYPEGQVEELEAVNHPDDPAAGTRKIKFGRELYIERDDFMENPPKKFFRLAPGSEVRLRYAYFITCREVKKNAAGEVVELRCSYDPATKGGNAPDGRKVKGTIHWVSAADAVPAEVRLYNPLFVKPDPDAANFTADLNPNSLEIVEARVEPALADAKPEVAGAVRAQRLFLPRQGFRARQARVQPHHRAARHLGEGEGGSLAIPGRAEGANPESRTRARRCGPRIPGPAPARRPGMTVTVHNRSPSQRQPAT